MTNDLNLHSPFAARQPLFEVDILDRRGAAKYAADLLSEALALEMQAAILNRQATMKRRSAREWDLAAAQLSGL